MLLKNKDQLSGLSFAVPTKPNPPSRLQVVLLLFCGLSALAGCASTDSKIKARMNTWIGTEVREFQDTWGPPAEIETYPNGSVIHYYVLGKSRSVTYCSDPQGIRECDPSYPEKNSSIAIVCIFAIHYTKAGYVFSWSARGKGCSRLAKKNPQPSGA